MFSFLHFVVPKNILDGYISDEDSEDECEEVAKKSESDSEDECEDTSKKTGTKFFSHIIVIPFRSAQVRSKL